MLNKISESLVKFNMVGLLSHIAAYIVGAWYSAVFLFPALVISLIFMVAHGVAPASEQRAKTWDITVWACLSISAAFAIFQKGAL